MSGIVKFGPPWRRLVIDAQNGVLRGGLRRAVRLDDVRALHVVERINPFEVEQLLNAHPDVQKQPRTAELWVEDRSGRRLLIGEAPSAGRLLQALAPIAAARQLPLVSDRSGPFQGSERVHRST